MSERVAKALETLVAYYASASVLEPLTNMENWLRLVVLFKDYIDFAFAYAIAVLSAASGLPQMFVSFMVFFTVFYAILKILGSYIKKFLITTWVIFAVAVGLRFAVTSLL